MSAEDQRDGRTLFLTPVEEYGGKYDNGAAAMAAQDVIALNTYTGLGPFRADWQRKFVETNARTSTPRDRQSQPACNDGNSSRLCDRTRTR